MDQGCAINMLPFLNNSLVVRLGMLLPVAQTPFYCPISEQSLDRHIPIELLIAHANVRCQSWHCPYAGRRRVKLVKDSQLIGGLPRAPIVVGISYHTDVVAWIRELRIDYNLLASAAPPDEIKYSHVPSQSAQGCPLRNGRSGCSCVDQL